VKLKPRPFRKPGLFFESNDSSLRARHDFLPKNRTACLAHSRGDGRLVMGPKPIKSAIVLLYLKRLANPLVLMKRNTTFAAFAVFAFLSGSAPASPAHRHSTGPV